MDTYTLLLRLGVALAIGLLTGIERSWTQRHADHRLQLSDVRSYVLTGLTGGMAGVLGRALGPILTAAVFRPLPQPSPPLNCARRLPVASAASRRFLPG